MTVRLTGARWITLATVATVSVLALQAPSHAASGDDSAPPSGQITLDVQTVNGSGCPTTGPNDPNAPVVDMQPDNTGFRIRYKNFVASDNGGGGTTTSARKNCQVSLQVHIPQGFTFAVARADYYGKAHLQAGATALERTNYYYQGSSDNNYADHPFTGPYNGSWHTTDITATADLVFAPCGVTRGLNINTELRVDGGTQTNGSSYISLRTSEGDVYTLIQFQWKQC